MKNLNKNIETMKRIFKKLIFIFNVLLVIVACGKIGIAQDIHFSVGGGAVMPMGDWGNEDSKLLSSEEWNIGYTIGAEIFVTDSSNDKALFGVHVGFSSAKMNETEVNTLLDYVNSEEEYAPTWDISGTMMVFEVSPMLKYMFSDPKSEGLKIFGQLELGYSYLERTYSGKSNQLSISPTDQDAIKLLENENMFHNFKLAIGPGVIAKKYIEILPEFHLLYNINKSQLLMYPSLRVGVTF